MTGPLDMSQDPDRYDPDRDAAPAPPPRLDPALDPDRYRPDRLDRPDRLSDPTLSDLLGRSAGDDDEPRDTYTWFLGLLGVLAFLGLVALLFGRVLSPG